MTQASVLIRSTRHLCNKEAQNNRYIAYERNSNRQEELLLCQQAGWYLSFQTTVCRQYRASNFAYSLQKGTYYYTRWRKYAREQKLTSSPLMVRVYALSTFADTTRLTPFGCNFLNSCKPSESKASAFHLASIAIGAFSSQSKYCTFSRLWHSTVLPSLLDPVNPSKLLGPLGQNTFKSIKIFILTIFLDLIIAAVYPECREAR